MDAEFVAFLDQKFATLEVNLRGEIRLVREDVHEIRDRVVHLEEAMEQLTRAVDRLVKIYEDVAIEQEVLRMDIDRIKTVIREKLGVEL